MASGCVPGGGGRPGINIAVGHRPKSDHFQELADHFRFRSAVTSDHI